jgi:hypothetical protein
LDNFRFTNETGFSIYDLANVDCGKSEIKPQLVVGGIYLVTGRILATVGGSNAKWQNEKCKNFTILRFYNFAFVSEPREYIQKIIFACAGNLEALAVAHDHLTAVAFDVFFNLLQVDQRRMMDTEKMILSK